jgi:predicted PurR-regulated permease PerM
VGVIERIGIALGPRLRKISTEQVESFARALEAQAGQTLQFGAQASRGLGAFLSSIGNFFGYVLLVPVYTFFLLLSLSDLRERLRELLPGRYRTRILDIGAKIDRSLAAFFRGRLAIAILKGLATWLGLWIVGVPFAFFIGLVAGALSIIPFLGPIVGGVLALALAYEGEGGYGGRVVGVIVTFGVAETLENLLYPVLIGREVGLHPLALILSLFAFGKLFGLFGVLLAVPIACVLKILLAELLLPVLRQLAQEAPTP